MSKQRALFFDFDLSIHSGSRQFRTPNGRTRLRDRLHHFFSFQSEHDHQFSDQFEHVAAKTASGPQMASCGFFVHNCKGGAQTTANMPATIAVVRTRNPLR